MSNRNMINELGTCAMESFYSMRNAQPPKDRLHYFDSVLEGSADVNAKLLQKLYTDIISKSNIDFGRIPDSRGDITKYVGYSLMSDAMTNLNKLFKGVKSDELTLMNKLHDLIIMCRKDYTFGYSMDIEIVKIAYCTSVMTLNELINICILAYTRQMRINAKIELTFKSLKKEDVIVIKGAKSLIKSYESGQWTKMMNQFKKDPSFINTEYANEGALATIGAGVAAAARIAAAAPKVASAVASAKFIAIPVAVIVSLIAVFVGIRELIYLFYNNSCKLKDYAKNQKEFVDVAIRNEKEEGTSELVIQKHSKIAEKLQSVANYIEVHILKTNTEAKKDLEASNKENYSKSEFSGASVGGFGGDIEL